MLFEGSLNGGHRLPELAARGADQAATAAGRRECPRAISDPSLLLQPGVESFRLIQTPEADERLDGVGQAGDDRRLRRPHPLEVANRRIEMVVRLGRPPEREL